MFIQNKYYYWYLSLVISRQDRGLNKKSVEFYTEKHHVVPKCMGGSNETENLVLLSGREHYLAHWLLCKCVNKNDKNKYNRIASAFWRMVSYVNDKHNGNRSYTSTQYQRAKQEAAKAKSIAYQGRKVKCTISEEERERRRNWAISLNLTLTRTPEQYLKAEATKKSRPKTEKELKTQDGSNFRTERSKIMRMLSSRRPLLDTKLNVCWLSTTNFNDHYKTTFDRIKRNAKGNKWDFVTKIIEYNGWKNWKEKHDK